MRWDLSTSPLSLSEVGFDLDVPAASVEDVAVELGSEFGTILGLDRSLFSLSDPENPRCKQSLSLPDPPPATDGHQFATRGALRGIYSITPGKQKTQAAPGFQW